MKKFLLFVGCLALVATNKVVAQVFTVPTDTVKVIANPHGTTLAYNNITNIATDSIRLTWYVVESNFPSDWIPTMGFCDNNICYSNSLTDSTLWNGSTGAIHTTYPIPPGSTAPFDASMGLSATTTSGTYYADVKFISGGQQQVVRFIFTRWPTSVNNVSSVADISMYPNPASNQINVVFDPNSDIKTIGIYNVIGKMEIISRVGAQNSAGINISNLPKGVYFMSLRDSKGSLVATRKFIKD